MVKNISGTCRSVETQDSTLTGTTLARRSSQEAWRNKYIGGKPEKKSNGDNTREETW